MAISIAATSGQIGPQRENDGRLSESVTITGSSGAAGDNNTFTSQFLQNPEEIDGGFTLSVSGRTCTITANDALSNRAVKARIYGKF